MERNDRDLKEAIAYIKGKLEENRLRWMIVTGFACALYGVKRGPNDIDIDVDASKDDEAFKAFLESVSSYVQEVESFKDENYDLYSAEIVYKSWVFDISTAKDLKMFDTGSGAYKNFYSQGFPNPTLKEFEGMTLPVMPKEMVLRLKESLVFKRTKDREDIRQLKLLA